MHKRICIREAEGIDRGLRRRPPERGAGPGGEALPLPAMRAARTPRGRLRAPWAATAAVPRLSARCWGRGKVPRPGGIGGRGAAPGAIVPRRSGRCAAERALGAALVCRPCPCGGIDLQPVARSRVRPWLMFAQREEEEEERGREPS